MALQELMVYEQTARMQLANGIPLGAPSCDYHRNMLERVNLEKQTGNGGTLIPLMETNSGQVTERITQETALLPFCYTCITKAQGLQSGQQPKQADLCKCATHITSAPCWYCQAGILEGSKRLRIQERSLRKSNGQFVVKCVCGTDMRGLEGARQCAACGGIVTATFAKCEDHTVVTIFKNMAGNGVVFEPHTATVKRLLPRRPTTLATPNGKVQCETPPSTSENRPNLPNNVPSPISTRSASPGSTLVFSAEDLEKIKALCLKCDSVSCDPTIRPTALHRAQVILKMNPKIRMSQSTIVQLFEISGFEKGVVAEVRVKLKSHKITGWPNGEELALVLLAMQCDELL